MHDIVKMHSFKTENHATTFVGTLDPQVEVLVEPTKTRFASFVPRQGNRRTDNESPVWVVVVAD